MAVLLLPELKAQQTPTASGNLINSGILMNVVKVLSSEPMAGRLPGHEGYEKAANFMAAEFANSGLIQSGDQGYFQHLTVEYNAVLAPCTFEIHIDNEIITPRHGTDFTFRGFTGAGDVFAQLVFAGYGVSVPEHGYDDYAGIDVNNKIVMVFRSNPGWKLQDIPWPGALPREKANIAFAHGAAAIMFVSAPEERQGIPEVIGSVLHGPGEQLKDFIQMVISRSLADRMIARSGKNLESLFYELENGRQPASLELKTKAHISVRTEYRFETPTYNIVGMIEGSDPYFKNEFVVIGAHLDHVGSQCGTIYYPGANDNASGSAAVLEIARAFRMSETAPARSLIFVFFASEEQGLQGAEHFIKHCPVPHEKIIAMLNFDCIAHGDSIQLGNGKSSPELWELARNLDSEKMVVDRTWNGGGADLTPFFNAGIPGLYFVSTNSYTHLHSPGDTPETLNPVLFENIVRLGFRTAFELAQGRYNREVVQPQIY